MELLRSSIFANLAQIVGGIVDDLETLFWTDVCKQHVFDLQTEKTNKIRQDIPRSATIKQRIGRKIPASATFRNRAQKRQAPKLGGDGVTPHGVFDIYILVYSLIYRFIDLLQYHTFLKLHQVENKNLAN